MFCFPFSISEDKLHILNYTSYEGRTIQSKRFRGFRYKWVCDLSHCTARQRKLKRNTIELHCWISHSKGILNEIRVAVEYNVRNRKLAIVSISACNSQTLIWFDLMIVPIDSKQWQKSLADSIQLCQWSIWLKMKTAFISLIQRTSATGIIGKRNRTEQIDLAINN